MLALRELAPGRDRRGRRRSPAGAAASIQAIAQELASGHDIVGPGRAGRRGDGEPQDLDEHVRFVPIVRPPRPPACMEGRAVAAALHGLGVDHDHRRERLAVVEHADDRRETGHRPRPHAVRAPAPPLGPDRGPRRRSARAGSATGSPGGPMNSIASTIWPARDDRRRAAPPGRVEQVGDELPLLIGEGRPARHGGPAAVPRYRDRSARPCARRRRRACPAACSARLGPARSAASAAVPVPYARASWAETPRDPRDVSGRRPFLGA